MPTDSEKPVLEQALQSSALFGEKTSVHVIVIDVGVSHYRRRLMGSIGAQLRRDSKHDTPTAMRGGARIKKTRAVFVEGHRS